MCFVNILWTFSTLSTLFTSKALLPLRWIHRMFGPFPLGFCIIAGWLPIPGIFGRVHSKICSCHRKHKRTSQYFWLKKNRWILFSLRTYIATMFGGARPTKAPNVSALPRSLHCLDSHMYTSHCIVFLVLLLLVPLVSKIRPEEILLLLLRLLLVKEALAEVVP
jgi:hypothetical protein